MSKEKKLTRSEQRRQEVTQSVASNTRIVVRFCLEHGMGEKTAKAIAKSGIDFQTLGSFYEDVEGDVGELRVRVNEWREKIEANRHRNNRIGRGEAGKMADLT